MATTRNIQMQYYNGTDYDVLYPMANYQNMVGTPPGISGDLSFSDISGTVSTSQLPTVPISKGGTGATTAATARSNLGITLGNIGAAASSHNHSASNITSGTLPLTRGGTGATSASGANGNIVYGSSTLSSLSTSYYLPVASSSSAGYKVSMSTLGNYIMSTFGGSSSGLSYRTGNYVGTGMTNNTIHVGADYILFYLTNISGNDRMYMDMGATGMPDFDRNGYVYPMNWLMFFKIPGMTEVDVFASDGVYYKRLTLTLSGTSITFEDPPSVDDVDDDTNSSTIDDRAGVMYNYMNDDYAWLAITRE